jgi:hypothetical protein
LAALDVAMALGHNIKSFYFVLKKKNRQGIIEQKNFKTLSPSRAKIFNIL